MNSAPDFTGPPCEREKPVPADVIGEFTSKVILLVLLAVFMHSDSRFAAANDVEATRQATPNHGPIDLLKLEIFQSRDAADLLRIADRQFAIGNQVAAFQALQAVFETRDSDFINVDQQNGNASVYEQGITRLTESSFKTRMAWATSLEPLAKVELQAAQHDENLLQKVARRYPLTQSGLTAHLLWIRNQLSRQQVSVATASILHLQKRYSGLTVPFTAQRLIDGAKQQIDRVRGESASPEIVPGGLVSTGHESQIKSWEPVWRWKENVWETPQIASAFAGLLQPTSRTDLVLNSWQPAVSGNKIFKRSPTRLVCFDAQSGEELWWVPTDTFPRGMPETFSKRDSSVSPPKTTLEALRMSDLGTLSVCPDFVFFVDHYRDFQIDTPTADDFSRVFNRANPGLFQQESNGDRLVAISRTDPPSIAWTVGSMDTFDYEVKSISPKRSGVTQNRLKINSDRIDSDENETDVPKPVLNFQGHRFLGPPLIHEQNLYVLTADEEVIWLNCLAKGTGRLLYRQMIADIDAPSQYINQRSGSTSRAVGASVVGVHHGTLLCLLNRGLVIGASISDGRLRWATSLLTETQQQKHPSARYVSGDVSRPAFLPVLDDGHLIWSATGSDDLSCLNCETGSIKWQIPRSSAAPGLSHQSSDLLPAGINNGQLLVTGERHIRSIAISDGTVNWTTGINEPNGKAVIAGQTCWIPTISGLLVPVDVSTGEKGLPVETSRHVAGSLFQSNNRIISATPISIEAYPLAPPVSDTATEKGAASSQSVTATLLYSHQTSEQLTTTLADHSAQMAALSPQQQSQIANRIFSTDTPLNVIASLFRHVSPQHLTEEQKLRRQILLGDSEPITQRQSIVKLNSNWWVRADLAAMTFKRPLAFDQANNRLDQIIRQPMSLQNKLLKQKDMTFLDLADGLKENRPEAAELALLQQASMESTERKHQLHQRLYNLRNTSIESLQQSSTESAQANKESKSPFDAPLTFNVEQELHLTLVRPMNQFPQLTREPIILQTHSADPGQRLFLQNRKLFSVDLHRGSIATSIKLSGSVDQLIATVTPLSISTPSLLPLVEQTHVGVLSMVNPAKPKQLWHRRWDRASFDISPLRSGPVTASGIIFATNHRITCLHPLTGQLLWRRDFSMGETGRTFLPGDRFAANDGFLVALTSGYQSGTVFRMSDGQKLHTVKYELPKGVRPVLSGCHLLYPQDGTLKLIDLTSGVDLLRDSKVAIRPSSTTRMIDRHRAVILTADREIAVLNLRTAELESATEVPENLLPGNAAGFQAFEANGRLYVLLRRWDGRNRQLAATSAVGDRRLTSGTLISIDMKDGDYWSAENPTCVLMEIAGDPSPFLLTWSRQSPLPNRQFRFNDQFDPTIDQTDALLLRILDRTTGLELLRTDDLSWGNPLRCFHDSESRTITIETDASEIKLRYTAGQSQEK